MLLEFIRGQATIFDFLAFFVSAIAAITVHEFAHALRADQAGDPTPRSQGRVTLNPAAHYDPVGTTLILVAGFGWGRPVLTQPRYFRHPRRDDLMISLWGPLSNICLAVAVFLLLRFAPIHWAPWPRLAENLIGFNLLLAFFNLLPLHPLDGSRVVAMLLPIKQASVLDQFNRQYGMLVLMLILFGAPQLLHQWINVPSVLLIHTLSWVTGMPNA